MGGKKTHCICYPYTKFSMLHHKDTHIIWKVRNDSLFIVNIYIHHVNWHKFPGNIFGGCKVYQHDVLATKT
jgi:hypothetical protein